jgi:hypothetical protein
MAVMEHVSRPLIGLLVAVVAFFALWIVALKPGGGSSTSAPSTPALLSAVQKAHQAVATANAASVAHGGTVATAPSSTVAPGTKAPPSAAATTAPSTAVKASPATTHVTSPANRFGVVSRALKANKVLALLFYNSLAADDRAVKAELASVPVHGGRVVKLAVPLSELGRYTVVTSQVPVGASPTLVLIDPDQQASTIVGFSDRFEIAQRVSAALSVP